MTNRLSRAIADFENEDLDISLGERVSRLRSALMYDAYEALKRIGKAKNKREAEAKEVDHLERMKYFKDIEKMFISEIRMNKLLGKSEDQMNKDFLRRIKEEKGSLGDIVRDIRPISQTG